MALSRGVVSGCIRAAVILGSGVVFFAAFTVLLSVWDCWTEGPLLPVLLALVVTLGSGAVFVHGFSRLSD